MSGSSKSSGSHKNYPSREMEELFKAILLIKNINEASRFFRDLMTISEIREFANRWQIVTLLVQKKPYLDIAGQLNVSTTTVARCAHWLNEGSGGYKTIIKRYNQAVRKSR